VQLAPRLLVPRLLALPVLEELPVLPRRLVQVYPLEEHPRLF
jgi:hypothetical protein